MVMSPEVEINNLSFFEEPRETPIDKIFKYSKCCMGGTFDHMHLGHKILLTQACLLTRDVLYIGVSGDALLTKKAFREQMQSFEVRKQSVLEFISMLNPQQNVCVFELNDSVGVAAYEPDLQAVILTREVEKGGSVINEVRAKNNLQPLESVFVDMILGEADANKKNFSNKLSSTNIRKYLSEKH